MRREGQSCEAYSGGDMDRVHKFTGEASCGYTLIGKGQDLIARKPPVRGEMTTCKQAK